VTGGQKLQKEDRLTKGGELMNKDGNITNGLDRLNALFEWWGIANTTGNDGIDAQAKRLRALAFDLQKTYTEASGREMEALLTANERLIHTLHDILRSRNLQEAIAAQSSIVMTLLEAASLRARMWIELTEKILECRANLAGELPEEKRKLANTPLGRAAEVCTKDASQQIAHETVSNVGASNATAVIPDL